MRPTYVALTAVTIAVAFGATMYAFVQAPHSPTSPDIEHSATRQPFVLSLGESKMLGDLQVKFANTTYPPEGYDAVSLGAEAPDPPGTYQVRLEVEEEGDRQWFDLNELITAHHFHDYVIKFIGAGGDTVTLRIDAAPRNVFIAEAEAVRKALDAVRTRGKRNPLATTRTLQGTIWEIGMTFGLDDSLTVRIDADTGRVLGITTDFGG